MNDRDKEWAEIEKAAVDGSLYEADLPTLRRFLRTSTPPPPSTNSAFHYRATQIIETIRHLISERENEIQTAKTVKWAKVAAIAALLAFIAALVQILMACF